MPTIRQQCSSFSLGYLSSKFLRLCTVLGTIFIASTALAQAPAEGSNWDHLKALPPGTRLHVSSDKGGHTCHLVSVDDTSLVCGSHTIARSDIKSVKLTRYGVSTAIGVGIGAGVGVGVGLGLAGGKDSFFGDDKGKFAAGGAGIFGAIGGLITGPADLFRGPTVYRRN